MSWSFRRSQKFGPFRINFSKRGIGASVGVPGARLSVGPRGTYVSFGAGGFRYRQKISGRTPEPARRQPSSVPAAQPPSFDQEGLIHTATAATLALVAPDQVIAELQSRLVRSHHFKTYAAVGGSVALLLLGSLPPLGVIVAVLVAALAFPVYRWDRDRRTAQLVYDFEDPEIQQRFDMANRAGHALASASKLWHVHHSIATSDWKRNAGAGTLVRRTPIRAMSSTLPGIEINIQPWSVPIGPQQLLFLPDRLLVWDGRALAGVAYEHLMSQASVSQFIEDEGVPPDAQIVGTTWQYVNKNGGPDRRYANNRQLPIVQYGVVHLATHSGLHVFLQTSSLAAAHNAVQALAALSLRAQSTNAMSAMPAASPIRPQPDEFAAAVMVLIRHLAAADRRIDTAEIGFAYEIYKNLPGVAPQDPATFASGFRQLGSDPARFEAALGVLVRADLDSRQWILGVLDQLTVSDGKRTPKEAETLASIRSALGLSR